jgi:hypothetical protein
MEKTWKIHGETGFSIEEIVKLTGRSSTSIYRYIKSGKLKAKKIKGEGKPSYVIAVNDAEGFFDIDWKKHEKNMLNTENTMKTPWKHHEKTLTQENLMETMEKFFSTKQAQLMKPLEEQALFLAGKLTQENQFFKERLETLVEENKQLRESIKALPGPVDEIKEKLKIFDEEKQSLNSMLIEKSEKLKVFQYQIETIKKEKQELEIKLKIEKEELQKEIEQYRKLPTQFGRDM